ncbi:MAG TPA: TldD/PmbA family protein [Vicinamibacterales bacterium]
MATRREFLAAGGLAAIGLGLNVPGTYARSLQEPLHKPGDPKYREWSTMAMAEAKRLGCSYADIRFTRNRSHGLRVRNGQLTTLGGNINFGNVGDSETYGFGVRVIHSGVWGFSSSPIVTPEEIRRIVRVATDVARASAVAKRADVRLAPVPAYDTFWETPIRQNPWDVPLEDKIALLVKTTDAIQKNKAVLFATAVMNFNYEWKYLGTSEGSFIEQVFFYTTCGCSATARHQGQVKTRNYSPGSMTRGYEFVVESDMPGHAERVAAEAVEHAMAKPVTPGLKDLVLLPSHLALTIHEIIAHPTELDRIAGYEANYAGTSFIKLSDLGKLKYGSRHLNVYADRTFPGGMSTVGYDDDGVKAQRWPIIREGILVGLQTNRETAHLIGENESRGCTFANHWRNYPFLRMPNIQLEAGPEGSPTVDEMIADVKDGVLVDGMGSFSIDQQRYNGQFGGDAFWEIKNGKKTRMVTDFTYNAITTDFWANLDAVGPPSTWEHHGMGGDAKGQPVQSNRPSHGSAPCLVRKIMVGTAFS